MPIALIGTILGFITSGIPELIKLWREKRDQAHEVEVMKLQMEAQAQGHQERLEEINTQADIAEGQATLKAADVQTTGVGWVDGFLALLNSSVRPVLTYCFFWVYALVKYGQYYVASHVAGDVPWAQAVGKVWTDDDMAIFCTIIAFWFGQRSLARMRQQSALSGGTRAPKPLTW